MKRILISIALYIFVTTFLIFPLAGCANEIINSNSLDPGEIKEQTAQYRSAPSLKYASGFKGFGSEDKERSFHSDLDFFETVMSYGKNTDPRVTFLMVNAYLAHNQHAHGIEFFEKLLQQYEKNMDDEVRATYLAAYAILRATYANEVSLFKRIGWVNDTFDLLEAAAELTHNKNPLVRWSAGLIYAQVPFFFFKKDEAYAELNWLAEHPESEPVPGFYREVYFHLSKLHASDGETDLAAEYLKKSGYDSYEPKALFMGWFTTTQEAGATMFSEPALKEIVPKRIFSLHGFGYSDVFFVVSDGGKHLIAIDAGTQPGSLKNAHERLKSHYPALPPITTVIITHAHWDHIGGYTYLKNLNPDIKIYGRGNYKGTVKRVLRNHSYQQFRGAGFKHQWVKDYQPDISIDQLTEITIDGTPIELIPVVGGETEDAMLVFMPELNTLFVGDILMPYYGEPWVEEGFVDAAVATMDEVIKRNAKHILHGHYPLTELYGLEQIKKFRDAYAWLVSVTRDLIRNGYSVKDIVRLNLIPPGLQNHPDIYLSYLTPRDHLIARVADNMVGIWQEDVSGKEPEGLDNLTSVEYGRFLQLYLGLSATEIVDALQKMIAGGDNELAFRIAIAAEKRYAANKTITNLKEEAADRIRSAAQFFDPFKFISYTEMIGKEHKPILKAPVSQNAGEAQ
ncbi:MAG: MBL fold metallo-hydrolase [Gammaproteobacteria bacterium]|nr:MBL fold metallo-hydrolase [Gammaproteobacteria bacterium]MCF6261248.1 MBL fold metallo-hydrolase [Gammaproteobacteria bacterium]